jgi:sec-independent protein translocase protein TatC
MKNTEPEMPITDHLNELRTRVTWIFLFVMFTAAIAFAFNRQIISILLIPFPDGVEIVQIGVTEGLGVSMKVALVAGLFVAFPIIAFQTIMFVKPALEGNEKRYIYYSMPIIFILFLLGISFSFFLLLPFMMKFLPTFLGDLVTPQISVKSVVGTTLWLMFVMGFIFQIPVVMFVLAKIGILDPHKVAKQRKFAILLSVIAGAVITPTGDPINMLIWAGPIWILFEIGLVLARIASDK